MFRRAMHLGAIPPASPALLDRLGLPRHGDSQARPVAVSQKDASDAQERPQTALRTDYSGPFDPELSLTDFSRQALADLGRE